MTERSSVAKAIGSTGATYLTGEIILFRLGTGSLALEILTVRVLFPNVITEAAVCEGVVFIICVTLGAGIVILRRIRTVATTPQILRICILLCKVMTVVTGRRNSVDLAGASRAVGNKLIATHNRTTADNLVFFSRIEQARDEYNALTS